MKQIVFSLFIIINALIIVFILGCDKEDEKKHNFFPNCKIIVPVDGTEVTQGETIIISVEANDKDGSIAEVRFYIDEGYIGSDDSQPYNKEWNTNGEKIGNHTIKAIAIDNIGDKGISNDIEVFLVLGTTGEPCPGMPTINYEGKEYNTVIIGSQCWLKENLDVGTMISANQGQTNNGVIEKYCYDNDPANCEIYGGLYQWNEMMKYTSHERTQGICPDGWYIPSRNEWKELKEYLGGLNVAGGKLKEMGTVHWNNPNTGATNESGFSALPGGYLDEISFSSFDQINEVGHFWTSTMWANIEGAYYYQLYHKNEKLMLFRIESSYGFSVRCVRK